MTDSPMHYESYDDMRAAADPPDHPVGTTWADDHGRLTIKRSGDRWVAGITDRPAPCRQDDPPWYVPPTHDRPGQVLGENYPDPDDLWEWRRPHFGTWISGLAPRPDEVVEARRVEAPPMVEVPAFLIPADMAERLRVGDYDDDDAADLDGIIRAALRKQADR